MEKNQRLTDQLLIPHPIHKDKKTTPSNPIHKDQKTFQPQAKTKKSETKHEILKAGVFIAAAISAFAVYRIF